ncbi:MAG TPA: recombination mediator RecR [bacterium]|nr:recombination mediator RecR [bacterium]
MRDDPVEKLARLLARLPGIGEKSGARLAHYIWRAPGRYADELALAVREVRERVQACPVCGKPSVAAPCEICSDPDRDHGVIMVVEEPQDLAAIEKTGAFTGTYHVLMGTLSPLAGRGPDDLNIASLIERARDEKVREIILATNPSAEGDATAAFIEESLAAIGRDLNVSRLARGIPTGSQIKYLDPLSLEQAIKDRRGRGA